MNDKERSGLAGVPARHRLRRPEHRSTEREWVERPASPAVGHAGGRPRCGSALSHADHQLVREFRPMSIVRSIEVIAQSTSGFDDACRQAIKEASHTVRGIRSFWIKNAECIIEDDEITMFRVNGKISFMVEREEKRAKAEREAAGDKPHRRSKE
jgi:dodecin